MRINVPIIGARSDDNRSLINRRNPICKREFVFNAETPTTRTALPSFTVSPAESCGGKHSVRWGMSAYDCDAWKSADRTDWGRSRTNERHEQSHQGIGAERMCIIPRRILHGGWMFMPCPPPGLHHCRGRNQLRLLFDSGITFRRGTIRPHTSGDIPERFNRFNPDKEVYPMHKAIPSTEQQTAVLFGLFGGGGEEKSQRQTAQAILEGKNLTI